MGQGDGALGERPRRRRRRRLRARIVRRSRDGRRLHADFLFRRDRRRDRGGHCRGAGVAPRPGGRAHRRVVRGHHTLRSAWQRAGDICRLDSDRPRYIYSIDDSAPSRRRHRGRHPAAPAAAGGGGGVGGRRGIRATRRSCAASSAAASGGGVCAGIGCISSGRMASGRDLHAISGGRPSTRRRGRPQQLRWGPTRDRPEHHRGGDPVDVH